MRRIRCLIGMTIMCILFAGCMTDSIELDNQLYTLVLGIDIGADNRVRVTFLYPVYKSNGGSGSEISGGGEKEEGKKEKGGAIIDTIEAATILDAINLINTSVPRRISMVHTKVVVFSETAAKRGIAEFLETIERYRETRGSMRVIICKGRSEEFIEGFISKTDESIAKTIELSFLKDVSKGYFITQTFHDFYEGVHSPYRQASAVYAGINDFENLKPLEEDANSPLRTHYDISPGELPRTGQRKIEMLGTAVFNGPYMVGSLNYYETMFLSMITGEFRNGNFSVEDKSFPGRAIPLDIRLGRKPKISAQYVNDIPVIAVKLSVEADISAIQSRIKYENLERLAELENQIEFLMETGMKKTITKAQYNFGADIFDFGHHIAKHFATIQEFEEYNWPSRFKESQVNVEANVNIRRTGRMFETSPRRIGKITGKLGE